VSMSGSHCTNNFASHLVAMLCCYVYCFSMQLILVDRLQRKQRRQESPLHHLLCYNSSVQQWSCWVSAAGYSGARVSGTCICCCFVCAYEHHCLRSIGCRCFFLNEKGAAAATIQAAAGSCSLVGGLSVHLFWCLMGRQE
jgi:hypothetical protein